MRRKSIGIFLSLLMLVTSLGPIIFTDNDLYVKATSGTRGNVGLDYSYIYGKLNFLSSIIKTDEGIDNGIYKGRDFGTDGDRYAAEQIYNWMEDNSDNLTGSHVYQEPIGYDNGDGDKWDPHKSDIEGFCLQLKNGTHDAFTISSNESMPVVCKTRFSSMNYDTRDFITIEPYTKIQDDTYPLDEYDYQMFNVTYTRINDLNNFSQISLDDELVYIENYTNLSLDEKEGRIHLINVSNNELNETVNLIVEANATGFLLIRNDISDIQGWEFPIPGLAVSNENGSLIKSYIENESLVNVSVTTPETPVPPQGNLTIYYFNSSVLALNKKILLIDSSTGFFRLAFRSRCPCVVGLLEYNKINDNLTHWGRVPNNWESIFFFSIAQGFKLGMKAQLDSYASFPKPKFIINRTIYADDGPHDIDTWVNSPNQIKARLWLNWTKNLSVDSYNVYCTVPGTNSSKTVIISGGHYDGFWGQMATDDASGVAVMLGILKYMNDNHITPKCNLVFITFSGEEYIDKGSRGYVLRHWDEIKPENIDCIINLDTLAHDLDESKLIISVYNRFNFFIRNSIKNTVDQIAERTHYYENTQYPLETVIGWIRGFGAAENHFISSTDQFPFWLRGITAIDFGKEPYESIRHQTGSNHTRGDNMTHIDWNDLNYTSDLVWNVSKYFTVDPDCWFENITYQKWDSSTDNNTLIDSVNVTFSINSSLPQDRIWVKATLISQDYPILCRYKEQQHYTITPSGIQDTISITLPQQAPKGNYTLQVFLYNSTGEIDRSLITLLDYRDFGKYANEIYQTDEFSLYLYPSNDQPEPPHQPWGDTQVSQFKINIYKSHTTDPNDDHLWYQWQYEYHQLLGPSIETRYTNWTLGGPHDSGKNDTTYIIWLVPGTYNVRVRAKDNIRNPNMITDWSPPLQVTVSPFINGSIPWSSQFISAFSLTRVAEDQQTECNGFVVGVLDGNEGSLNFTWDFGDNTGAYSENVNHAYSDEGNYTVNLTLKNSLNETYNFTTTISVVVLRAGFSTIGDEQPGKNIYFNDTSRGSSSLINWSWEFGDGNRSYDRNTSHMYTETGEYNITLTVRDTLNNTDIYTKPVFIESLAPEFVSVVDSSDRVGFGSNVMISADFFDNQSGVESAMVNITYPDNTTENFTMGQNVSSEHDYVYMFNDTWQNGVYNYSIWVVDHANNTNYTSGFNFTVSADATISICTVKNKFTNNESINLTDPPEQPVNTLDAWQLINRGETWNQYYDQQEKTYRFSCSDTPINYKDASNNYQPINTTIQPLIKTINNTLYTRGVIQGIYSLYLKQTMNATDTTPAVIIEKDRYRMTQTPPDTLMVSYNQRQKISTICTQNTSQITQDGNTALYEHAYLRYNTTDDYAQVSYQYFPTMMKSNLILTDQTAVQDRYTFLHSVLRTSNLWVHYQTQMTALDQIGNISLGVMQNDIIYRLYGENTTVDLWTADRIWFTDQNNSPVFGIPPLYAVDDAGNATLLMKHLYCEPNTDRMTLTIYVSLPWLSADNRTYPVYIDPSVEINAGSGDGWALQYGSTNWDTVHDGSGNSYSSSNLYAYGMGATCGTTGTYSILRSFFRFNTSSIPDDASIVDASVFLYGKNNLQPPYPTPQASGVVFQKWTGGGTISSGDYNDFSGGIYGSLSSWTTSIYNELVWENALSDIDVDGYTDICVREWAHDYNDSAPEEESSYSNYLTYADAPYNKPFINVTYELPPTSPEVSLIIPEDYAVNISLNPCVKVSVTQQEGKDVTVQWYQNATGGSWTLFATNISDGNETVMQNCPWINENGKWYHLKIVAQVSSWPSVQEYYQFYPGVQSKIENMGDTDINGFLVVWLEEYNATSGNWSYLDELYRDATMRRVNSSCSFGIDTVCNGLVNGSMLAGETGGVFRVYAGFYSMQNEVLVCSDDTELVAWWEFEIE